ncbi:MAG: hypothetical protein NTZ08_09275 [Verrucomicrobia bacterium]|nr:hypothetical protein [Verrucomicrobiota bacterium]
MSTTVRRLRLPLRFASVLALFGAIATSAAVTKTPQVTGGGESGSASVTVVNQSEKPVYATTLNLPADAAAKAAGVGANVPLELVRGDGAAIPLIRQKSDGGEILHAVVSLQPRERMEFKIRKAKAWGAPSATAAFDAQSGSGSLSNGILTLAYADGRWSLAYAGNTETKICQNNRLDFWLSEEPHGRLLGFKDDKLRDMNLLRSTENATLIESRATANPDGSATLVLAHRFPTLGENVVWEETFTLQASEPVLIYKTRWTCTDDRTRYLSYVEMGAGLKGDFGPLLQGKLRFLYDIPTSGSEKTASGISVANTNKTSTAGPRILLSGKNTGFTRVSWRNERCWVGVDSELGNGLAFSTLKDAYVRFIPGNTVWVINNTGYLIRLLDDVQENQPYAFSKEKPLELGFAIAATCGEVGIWNQGRNLFKAVTSQASPTVGDACTVYLNGKPVKPGETICFTANAKDTSAFVTNGRTLMAQLETDFTRPFQLRTKVSGATAEHPLKIVATSDAGEAFTVATFEKDGEETIDFTKVTGWLHSRRVYNLEIFQGKLAKMESLVLESAPFVAPELNLPADGLNMTDIATFFHWFQVPGAIDYEIQLARSPEFENPTSLNVRSEVDMPYYMPKESELPAPGEWFWRVRALEEGRAGEWSTTRRFTSNKELPKRPLVFKPTPENPLFTFEGCRVPDWSRFHNTIPPDIQANVAINTGIYKTNDHIGYLRPLKDMGVKTFLRTHAPAPMSRWAPLSMVEEVFQTYPNVIGISGGETLSAHFHGGEKEEYIQRLVKLCAKYGRVFYEADGSYPKENKYQALFEKNSAFMREYKDYFILAQKNNILHRQFVSQSSVLGLYLNDDIVAQGAWEDGGWYWQQVGFRKLGEILGQRAGDVTNMPRIFWTLNHVMGLARGCSVFSFEGQVGTTPVPKDWRIAEKGLPEITDAAYRNPAAFWTTDGELTETFDRFCLPFIRGLLQKNLVPTKQAVLRNVKIAVFNDEVSKYETGDQYYYEWEALFRGTYGFRDVGVHPGTLMEFFPNTGRFYFIPVLPQGKRDLGPGVEVLPLSRFKTEASVKQTFDAAYPAWYSGNAFVAEVADTLTVLNSCENSDETQTYDVPLKNRGGFEKISGKIGPHAYLVGKFENKNKSFWLQSNTEYPERDTELEIQLKSKPQVKITPDSAALKNTWNPTTRTLSLRLSHKDGAVNLEIQ